MKQQIAQANTVWELQAIKDKIIRLRKHLTGRTVRRMMKDDIEYIKIKIKEMR